MKSYMACRWAIRLGRGRRSLAIGGLDRIDLRRHPELSIVLSSNGFVESRCRQNGNLRRLRIGNTLFPQNSLAMRHRKIPVWSSTWSPICGLTSGIGCERHEALSSYAATVTTIRMVRKTL
jgi:hypothetical protein